MKKYKKARFGIIVLFLVAIIFGMGEAVAYNVIRVPRPSNPPAAQYPLRAAISLAPRDMAADDVEPGGNTFTQTLALQPGGDAVTQTITLHAGWNAIYLEVEPINTSPLVNEGTEEDPVWVHEKTTMEAVFAQLACENCLESVWAWNVPFSTKDYIVDPAEGLWDEPGWLRYFPEGSAGPDGGSRTFLTDLLALHANTAYLVKLDDVLAAPLTLSVAGQPVAENQRWLKDSYNLAGFPISPDTNPTVAVFFGNSAVTEVRQLTSDGHWEKIDDTDTLAYGQSYLAYFDGEAAGASEGFKPPLSVDESVPDELEFSPGVGGERQTIPLENTCAIPITVTISFAEAGEAAPPLYYEDAVTDPPTYIDLRTNAVNVPLAPGEKRNIVLVLIPDESPTERVQAMYSMQASDEGERKAVLVIASLEGGTRWMIPMAYEEPDMRGLWVGDVRINDVSEARLGATNADHGQLTIALRPRNSSGIYGATAFEEIIDGSQSLLAVQTVLDLNRGGQVITPTQAMTGTMPYLAGYIFEDLDQNGERDATEPGFGGINVTLSAGGSPIAATQTLTDGAYIFAGLTPGTYDVALDPATPPDATAAFDVTPPVADVDAVTPDPEPNAWPVQVTVDEVGITGMVREDYDGNTASVPDLPAYDAEDRRIANAPLVNFGYVSDYDATLWTGTCTDLLEKRRDLGQVRNGALAVTITSASLNPPPTPVDDQLLSDAADYALTVTTQDGEGLTCGEVIVGAQTVFTDGRGSEFRFRILLRLEEEAPGRMSLLPSYTAEDGTRTTSAAFSIQEPILSSGNFTDSLNFAIAIDYQDPLNPFKHKYHPDHDNLDAKFIPIDPDAVPPHLWEAYDVRRDIELEFTDLPPIDTITDTETLAQQVGWGGEMWGGTYCEVIKGLHKNDITVSGIFIIRHVLPLDQMAPQPYDEP